MKLSSLALSASLSVLVLAFPGMKGNQGLMDFHKSLTRRAATPGLRRRSHMPYPPGLQNTTSVGVAKDIKNCIDRSVSCEVSGAKSYNAPILGTKECNADQCCVWDYVVTDLVKLMTASDGQCNDIARQAIRLGFHDAGAWSIHTGFGGADGSMLLTNEISRLENKGLENIVEIGKGLLTTYSIGGIGAADLVQMMATVGTVVCPLGPRVKSYVGRKDGTQSPEGLPPSALSDADTLIALFADKTISPDDLAALVGAHSVSEQNTVDPSRKDAPQDSTPGVWDIAFYQETLSLNADPAVFKFPSDVNLSLDPRTSDAFKAFANPGFGQLAWNGAFAQSYVRLSILGVNNIDQLTDCTKVLPGSINQAPAGSSIKPSSSISSGAGAEPSSSSSSSSKAFSSGSIKPFSFSSRLPFSSGVSQPFPSGSIPSFPSGSILPFQLEVRSAKPHSSNSSKTSSSGKPSGTPSNGGEWYSNPSFKLVSPFAMSSGQPLSDKPCTTTTYFSTKTHTSILSEDKTSSSYKKIPVSTAIWTIGEFPSWASSAPISVAITPAAPIAKAEAAPFCLIKTVTTTVTVG